MGVKVNSQDDQDNPYCWSINRFGELLMQKLMNPVMDFGPVFHLSSFGKEFRGIVKYLKSFTRNIVRQRKSDLLARQASATSDVTDVRKKPAFLDLMLQHHIRDGK